MFGSRGFTLIELMVTFAVIAIVTIIAMPSMGNLIARQQLNKTTREVASTISIARSQAALLRTATAMCLDKKADNSSVTSAQCAGSNITGYSSMTAAQKTLVEKNQIFMAKVDSTVSVKTGSAENIVFSPTGKLSTTSDVTFSLCNSRNNMRSIIVSFLGAIRQTEGTC